MTHYIHVLFIKTQKRKTRRYKFKIQFALTLERAAFIHFHPVSQTADCKRIIRGLIDKIKSTFFVLGNCVRQTKGKKNETATRMNVKLKTGRKKYIEICRSRTRKASLPAAMCFELCAVSIPIPRRRSLHTTVVAAAESVAATVPQSGVLGV